MRHKLRFHSFTLIELMIVIGIIGILMSITLPALGRSRATALRTQCISNMRQSTNALTVYAADSNGWICTYGPDYTAWFRLGSIPKTLGFVIPPASEPMRPSSYRSISMCPSGGDDDVKWHGNIAFGAPFFSLTPYDYNSSGSELVLHDIEQYVNVHTLENAANYVLLADSAYTKYAPTDGVMPGVQSMLFARRDEGLASPVNTAICERHNGLANIAFLDGHVDSSSDKTTLLNLSKIGAYTDLSGSEFIFIEK